MVIDEQLRLIKRGTVEIVPEEGLRAKLQKAQSENRPLRIKLGLDPTAPDIHLGSAVVLRKMRQFQDLGHEVYIIIGDFTASIGDPTGRSITRPQLSAEEIKANAQTYYEQFCRILNPEKTKVVFNSEWLGPLSFTDVIKIASKVTVARILERDDFATRLAEGKPISVHELMYPICQAYDSVVLKSDVEVGGTEQKFNIMMGRDLQGQYEQEEQIGLFMPILPGLDGVQKMSKSLGNYVGITESPKDMFGKLMSIPDEMMATFYELCTDVPIEEIKGMWNDVQSSKLHPMDMKKRLGREIVGIYHSEEEGQHAQHEFERVFSNREIPEDMPEFRIEQDKMTDGAVSIVSLLIMSGLAPSKNEAKRLVQQGAVTVDGEKVADVAAMIKVQDGNILKAGKLKFIRLTM